MVELTLTRAKDPNGPVHIVKPPPGQCPTLLPVTIRETITRVPRGGPNGGPHGAGLGSPANKLALVQNIICYILLVVGLVIMLLSLFAIRNLKIENASLMVKYEKLKSEKALLEKTTYDYIPRERFAMAAIKLHEVDLMPFYMEEDEEPVSWYLFWYSSNPRPRIPCDIVNMVKDLARDIYESRISRPQPDLRIQNTQDEDDFQDVMDRQDKRDIQDFINQEHSEGIQDTEITETIEEEEDPELPMPFGEY